MKFLTALLAQLCIGLVFRLGVPTMCAMIVEHFITHPQIDDGFTRYPDALTLFMAGLFSSVCAALVTSTSATDKDAMLSIATRTCAFAGVWWFTRLALQQETMIDAAPFYAIAFSLLVATIASLAALPTRAREGGYVLYGAAAAVVVLFGMYTSGRKVLMLDRHGSTVKAALDTYRWMGMRRVSHRSASAVSGVVHSFQSNHFTEAGDGYVIQGARDEILLPPNDDLQSTIERFLNSSESTLVVVEPTSSPWRMSLIWLIASTVLTAGLAMDPLVGPPESKLARQASRVMGANSCVAIALFVLASAGTLWHWKSLQKQAREQIEMLGFTVKDADLKVRDEPLYGGAWKVTATDPSIDDARLAKLIPHLQNAPGFALDLSNSRVTDAGVRRLNDVDLLPMLELRKTAVTGAALAAFKDVQIWYLDVRDTGIRTSDLQMGRLEGLKYLLFSDPGFSGKSVNALLGLKRLKYAYIDTGKLTPADLRFWKTKIDFEIEVPPRAEAEAGAEAESRDTVTSSNLAAPDESRGESR
jgi:hypothetical protein